MFDLVTPALVVVPYTTHLNTNFWGQNSSDSSDFSDSTKARLGSRWWHWKQDTYLFSLFTNWIAREMWTHQLPWVSKRVLVRIVHLGLLNAPCWGHQQNCFPTTTVMPNDVKPSQTMLNPQMPWSMLQTVINSLPIFGKKLAHYLGLRTTLLRQWDECRPAASQIPTFSMGNNAFL